MIVVPAYNEEATLVEKVLQIEEFTQNPTLPHCDILIADNNSTDHTSEYAKGLSSRYNNILYHFVKEQGKGSAIRRTWLSPMYQYDAYTFMDADLSTDLGAFPAMIGSLATHDIAIGLRYVKGARLERSIRRRIISQTYRALFRSLFNVGIRDPQCGFKAIKRNVRDNLLPLVESDNFFFDTELLLRAHYKGYSIEEIPVNWKEDPSTTLNFKRDIPSFLYGLFRMKYLQLRGKLS